MNSIPLRLDFRTCTDQRSDESIKKHLEKICGETLNILGPKKVKSIILAGGVTRGEGSAISRKEKIEIFSDYDLLALVDKVTREISRKLRYISAKLTEEFSREGLPSHVDVVPVTKKGLSKMKATIFTLELKERGRTIYGEDFKKYMPDLKPEEIPRKDSLRLLHNRITGVLEYFDPAILLAKKKKNEQFVKFLIFHTAKNLVDLGRALLSFEKKYVCGYKERAKMLKRNFKKFDIAEKYSSIPEIVEKWTEFRLNPDTKKLLKQGGYASSYDALVELAREFWFEHIGHMEILWKYEVQKMYRTSEEDAGKLIDIYFKNNNTLKERLTDLCFYTVRKPIDLPPYSAFRGCLKSLSGSALIPSTYSFSDVLFFDAPAVLKRNVFPHKPSFMKYAKKIPVHSPVKGSNAQIWDIARKNVVYLWKRFVR